MQTETELRYAVPDAEVVRRRLTDHGAIPEGVVEVVDTWYVPEHIRSNEDHDTWLESGRAAPLRIRDVQRLLDRNVVIEVKRPIHPYAFNVNHEARIPLASFEEGENFAKALGYHCLAKLEKRRESYLLNSLRISIDSYSAAAITVLEFEAVSSDGPQTEQALRASCGTLVDAGWDELDGSAALLLIRRRLSDQ